MLSCEWPITLAWHLTNRKSVVREHDPLEVIKASNCSSGAHDADDVRKTRLILFPGSYYSMKQVSRAFRICAAAWGEKASPIEGE